MKNKSIIKSFINALEGVYEGCRTERNLRFHIVVANLICVFAYFFGLSSSQWGNLILTIACVISTELINTAIENAVDTATCEYKESAKKAKDTASAGVLTVAIGAVCVGIALFGDIKRIADTLAYIINNFKILVPCLILGALDIWFLIGFGKKKEEK